MQCRVTRLVVLQQHNIYNGRRVGYSFCLHFVTVKKIVRYYGQFRVPDLDFDEKWSDINLPEYNILATEVLKEVR